MIQTINPATGAILQTYPLMSADEIDRILEQTHIAYQSWCNGDLATRQQLLRNLHDVLLKSQTALSELISDEMGKPITQSQAEVAKCALLCAYYADHLEEFLNPRAIQTKYPNSYVSYEPQGTVFIIEPWNFPAWQVLRCLAPNLAAGNAVVLRHADCVTGCAVMLEKLVREAGFPENIFRIVITDHATSAKIIADPHIIGVALTGSERAGRSVASAAGAALKKVTLELGGSDPAVILADADLDHAADICVKSRLNNAGQVCISAKRFIAVESIYDEFKRLVLEKIKAYTLGNPRDPNCNLGPLAREDLRTTLHQQVQQSIAQGARLLIGGTLPEGPGCYYPITALENITAKMPAYCEELFGPVISFFKVPDTHAAIKLANDVRFGLGASLFTRDIAQGEKLAREKLQAGTCAINTFVTSDPALPFGGTKSSGFGRELSSEGMHEFMNVKTIYRA